MKTGANENAWALTALLRRALLVIFLARKHLLPYVKGLSRESANKLTDTHI